MIATDLDGTLLGPDAWVSSRTVSALRAVHDAGVAVVAVTGRSHHTAVERLAPVGIIRHAVCSNGATRYDLHEDRVVVSHPLQHEHVHAIVADVAASLPAVGFGFETTSGFVYDRAFLDHLPQLRARGHRPALMPHAAGDRPVVKVMIGHPQIRSDELLRRTVDLMPCGVSASTSGAPFVEVTAVGVDKAFGLAALCAELGIVAGEVVAFGDNLNDLPMLAWVGRSVAMGNAHPDVLAAATDHTESNADDGVAVYLERFLGSAQPASGGDSCSQR